VSTFGERVSHPFDGDGLVCKVDIRDGRAFFRSSFVETAE
jgi:all-trans-8'-apo-beta-carotenal 15,15'-oxygenase